MKSKKAVLLIGLIFVGGIVWFVMSGGSSSEIDFSENKLVEANDSVQSFCPIVKVGNGVAVGYTTTITDDKILYKGDFLGKEYNDAHHPFEHNGQLVYVARTDAGDFLVQNGEAITDTYEKIKKPKSIDDSLYFIDRRTDANDFLVKDGEKMLNKYDTITDYVLVDGQPAIAAIGDDGKSIEHKGEVVDDNLGHISWLKNIDGQIVYGSARVDPDNPRSIIGRDGEDMDLGIPENFSVDSMMEAAEINNELVYLVNGARGELVYKGGKEVGKFGSVYRLLEVNGELAISAETSFGDQIIYGDKKVGGKYDDIRCLTEIDDKLAFVGKRNGSWYLVREK